MKHTFFSFLIICAVLGHLPGAHADDSSFAVAWWNVQNLFDNVDDPDEWDDWMAQQPESVYRQKVSNLAAILNTMADGNPPELIAFGEVESRRVMDDLAKAVDGDYHVVHHPGNDHRGIEVALLSKFPVVSSESIFIYQGTRDLLHAVVNAHGKPLHLVIGHWKSRYGGVTQTMPGRMACALKTRQVVREIQFADPDADIVVIGDFNDSYDDDSVVKGLVTSREPDVVKNDHSVLYNVVLDQKGKPRAGTYNYKGHWSYLDQVVVSAGLLDNKGLAYVPQSFVAYTADGKLLKDGYPFRFTTRTNPPSGYADHLPIMARLKVVGE